MYQTDRGPVVFVLDDAAAACAYQQTFSALRCEVDCVNSVNAATTAITQWIEGERPPPDLLVFEIVLPDGDALELLPYLALVAKRPIVVAVSAHLDASRALVLAEAKIPVFPKPMSPRHLLRYFHAARDPIGAFCSRYRIEGRQKDVLTTWLSGLCRKESAEHLGISASSVATHWARVCEKVGVFAQDDVFRELVRFSAGIDVRGDTVPGRRTVGGRRRSVFPTETPTVDGGDVARFGKSRAGRP